MNEQENKRILFGRALCPFARKVILALSEKKLPFVFEMKMSDIHDDSLPILVDLNEHIVSGAYAISEYLEEVHKGNLLLGFNVYESAEIRRLVQWCDVSFYQQVTTHFVFERVYKFMWRLGMPKYQELFEIRKVMEKMLHIPNHLLSERSWFAGDNISYADLTLAAHISCLDFLGEVKWKQYDFLYEWYLRMKSRASFTILLHEQLPGIEAATHYRLIDFEQ